MSLHDYSEGGCPMGLHMTMPSTEPPLTNWNIHHEVPGVAGWVAGPQYGGCLGEFLNIGKCESGLKVSTSSAQYPPSEVCFNKMQMLKVPWSKAGVGENGGLGPVGTPHFHRGQFIGVKKPFPPAAQSKSLVSLCTPWPECLSLS